MSSLRSGCCSRRRAWRRWRGGGMRESRRARRCVRMRVRPRSRCRLRNGGCGSWTGWRVAARPTRSRWRCGCAARLTGRRWRRRSLMLLGGTRACARSSRRRWGLRASRCWSRGRRGGGFWVVVWAGGGGRRGRPRAPRAGAGGGFDLASEPPLRAHLFALGAHEHVLLLVLHHIAADGWSLAPLARDLGRCYRGRRGGEVSELAALPVQYADYTLWQHRVLGSESDAASAIARQLSFWRDRLAGLPEGLELAGARVRPAVASYRGGSVAVRLSAELHGGLLGLSRARGASLFMVLQAGLAALLTRLGAGSDIPIGSPIAGRTHR